MRGRYTAVSSLVLRELVLSQSHTLNGGKENKVWLCIFWCILEGNSFIPIVYQTYSQSKECRTGNWTTIILSTCIRQGIINTGMLAPVWLVRPWPNHFLAFFNGILCSRPATHILTAGNNLLPEPFLVTEDNVMFCWFFFFSILCVVSQLLCSLWHSGQWLLHQQFKGLYFLFRCWM